MDSEIIIEADGIIKTYSGSEKPALNDVNLKVKKGSFFGLLGPNGAGKTTLLSICTGLLHADAGRLTLFGLSTKDHLNKIKNQIGLVPQEMALYPSLSARENLQYFGSMLGLSGARLTERVQACLDIANLNDSADGRVKTFSGGLKRRLTLVVGLIHEPEILFLDEPTVGIDPQSRNFIYEKLKEMNAAGMTIIYTSHYMEEVEQLCEEIAIIDHGRIISQGDVDSLLTQSGSSVIAVRTVSNISSSLEQRIRSIPSVKESSFNGRSFTLSSTSPAKTVCDVVNLLEEKKVTIVSLSHGVCNLEQLFLSLTGSSLRD